MNVEDLSLQEDGIMVVIRRRKAAVFRAIQTIWVCGKFFGWDLLGNLKHYLSLIPSSGSLWRSVAPQQKQLNPKCNATNASTLNCIPRNMAEMVEIDHPEQFHSHSLRRTGATLLAMAGRSEEDIMSMGNWTSSSAAKRYIEDSMLTRRQNGEAIAIPGYTKPEIVKTSSKLEVEKPTSAVVKSSSTELEVEKLTSTSAREETEETPVIESPLPKKAKYDGISFSGAINQIVVVNSLDSVIDILKK